MKYLIVVIVLIVILGGGYYLMKGQSATQQQPTQQAQQSSQGSVMKSQPSTATAGINAVSYTGNGFQPHSITIKAGETVTWTNKDTDDMWVASNPHPTHTDYPGLDALKNIPPNGTYSFTFTKVGSWGYHNHLNPSQQGVVVVTQ